MGKVLASVIASIGLLIGASVLLDNVYRSEAAVTQDAGDEDDGTLFSLLIRLAGHQEVPSPSFGDRLTQYWSKDKMEEGVLISMIILTAMASILLLFTWYNLPDSEPEEENVSATPSGAAAVSLEKEIWSGAYCCITPHGSDGIKTYTITVKGEMSGNPCAQLKMTIHTSKDLNDQILNGLEEVILNALNTAEDIDSPQHLLEIVYNSAMEYLKEYDLLDD